MVKVLITGGGGDIAQAIAEELSECGDYQISAPTRAELDVTDSEAVMRYVTELTPDVLVNNAGYVKPQSIFKSTISEVDRHIDVDLKGAWYCTLAAAQANKNVRVVSIGSSAATKVFPTWAEYCACKAGLVMATQCWAQDGLDAVCVSPGRTRTKMRKGLYPNEDPSTLLDPADFARVVVKAIEGQYKPGTHINVNASNVKTLLED